jgi:predicted nucleotidyltransferase
LGVVPDSEPVEEGRAVAISIARELKARFGASRVMLFGSFARGDFHRRSDIDLAVWGIPLAAYYRAVAFASGFSKKFKVDLVDAEDCSESLCLHIAGEGVEL